MKNFSQGLNGISADMLKTVTQVSIEARQKAAEQANQEKAAAAERHESFRPLSADKIERAPRAIERLYAGMQPAYKTEQKEETIAERVAALKQPKVVVKHQPVPHDSYLLEPKVTLKGGLKRKMEAESVELTADDAAFLAQVNGETNEAKHDPVGKEDADVNNDGKVNSSDSYLKNRRAAIGASLKKFGKKALETLGHPSDEKMKQDLRDKMKKEEVEVSEEEKKKTGTNPFDWKNYKNDFVKKKPGELTGHESKKTEKGTQYTKKVEEEVEQIDEKKLKDTPGQEHICAVHVKHSKLGEGKTLFSQHAEPDADGNIAWYDVMFEEGIVRVETTELEILEACSHGNHKK